MLDGGDGRDEPYRAPTAAADGDHNRRRRMRRQRTTRAIERNADGREDSRMDARGEKRCWHAAAALDGERRNRAVKFSMGKKGPSRPPEDQPRAVLVESRASWSQGCRSPRRPRGTNRGLFCLDIHEIIFNFIFSFKLVLVDPNMWSNFGLK